MERPLAGAGGAVEHHGDERRPRRAEPIGIAPRLRSRGIDGMRQGLARERGRGRAQIFRRQTGARRRNGAEDAQQGEELHRRWRAIASGQRILC